jgi:hypothetical protein
MRTILHSIDGCEVSFFGYDKHATTKFMGQLFYFVFYRAVHRTLYDKNGDDEGHKKYDKQMNHPSVLDLFEKQHQHVLT